MANIGTELKNWSTTEASNQPDSTDATTLVGDLRAIQSGVRYIYSQDTIASATTCDLGSKTAGSLTISGTTTITGLGTVSAGIRKSCVFSGALVLTHNGTSLILPGAANITTAANDRAEFESLGSGNWRCNWYVKADGTPVIDVLGDMKGYISGLTMSTAGSSTTMSVAAGVATDSTSVKLMQLASAIGKTTSAWAVGTGNGGLDTGTIANSTWYHFYLIDRPDTGVVDVTFSTSASSPTLPTNYTRYRYIGSGLTNGSGQWTKFLQDGDDFYWDVGVLDGNGVTPSTTAAALALSVPTGFKVKAYMNVAIGGITIGNNITYINDPDQAVNTTAAALASAFGPGVQVDIWTNTSRQIRHVEANGTGLLYIVTLGYMNLRGK